MELHLNFIHRSKFYRPSGFTLMEVLIVIAIVAILASLPAFFTLTHYRQNLAQKEVETIKQMLIESRTSALVNRTSYPTGIAFSLMESEVYVQFEGRTFATSDPATHVIVSAKYPLKLSDTSITEVVFTPLTGTTTGGGLTFVDENTATAYTLNINYEGLIK